MKVIVVNQIVQIILVIFTHTLLSVKANIQVFIKQWKPLCCNTKYFHVPSSLPKTVFAFLFSFRFIIPYLLEINNVFFVFIFRISNSNTHPARIPKTWDSSVSPCSYHPLSPAWSRQLLTGVDLYLRISNIKIQILMLRFTILYIACH